MMETSARLLRLLTLLQSRREWSGPALAARLGVSARTVRTDIDRIRSLGYDVAAAPGVGGGYRLRSGTAVPPLFLEPEEAVAVAVGLRTAANANVDGIGAHALGALAKLEQLLPTAVQDQVRAVQTAIVAGPDEDPQVHLDVLRVLADACRDSRETRLDYCDHAGAITERRVEPLRLVQSARRWYLVAWDIGRTGWRTFRADRVEAARLLSARFVPREPPASDLARYVAARTGSAMWRHRAVLLVQAPADVIAAKVPAAVEVEPVDADQCLARVGSDSLDQLALYIGMLDADFQVLEPADLIPRLAVLAGRYGRAAAHSGPGSSAAVPR